MSLRSEFDQVSRLFLLYLAAGFALAPWGALYGVAELTGRDHWLIACLLLIGGVISAEAVWKRLETYLDDPSVVAPDPATVVGKQESQSTVTGTTSADPHREIRSEGPQTEEQRKAIEQARRLEAVGALAGGVAHDFNNLLTVILGRTEFMLAHPRTHEQMQRDLRLVQQTAERAAALTQHLLAFSRQQVLAPASLDLNIVAVEMSEMFRSLLGENIEVRLDLAPSLRIIWGDRTRLEQVLLNLVVNARDAMPQGGRITISTQDVLIGGGYAPAPELSSGDYVGLTVSDSGSGMEEALRERIFEPFFTTKSQGTGLGLSTVYGIVQQHKGAIVVRSEIGRGSEFKIYLPAQATRSQVAPRWRAGRPEATDKWTRGETILLVDDEEAVRELAADLLEVSGYRVLQAVDGPSALRVAKAEREGIALLLTDVVMPGMSGWDLADLLVRSSPDLKVLYMSGYAAWLPAWVEQGREFVPKPFTSETLMEKVRVLLSRTDKSS